MAIAIDHTEQHLLDPSPEGVVDAFLQSIQQKQISLAVELFADAFIFDDYGLRLKFTDKQQLAEFFNKQTELYPDSRLTIDMRSSQGANVTLLWTRSASIQQPGFGGWVRSVPVVVRGASVIIVRNGKLTQWAEFYDGPNITTNSFR